MTTSNTLLIKHEFIFSLRISEKSEFTQLGYPRENYSNFEYVRRR